jgi:hypothetical protein
MLEEMVAWQPPSGGNRPVLIGSRPSEWVSNRLFLGGLLPSRPRFRFTGHQQYWLNPDPARQSNALLNLAVRVHSCPPPSSVISTLHAG